MHELWVLTRPHSWPHPDCPCLNARQRKVAGLEGEEASMSEARQRMAGAMAALLRFPAERLIIDLLLLRDSDFSDMCEELAAAELALQAAEALPLSVREERIAEWAASIDQLTAEIARALRNPT